MKRLHDDYKLADEEIASYEFLRRLERLMEDHGDTREAPWGQLKGSTEGVLVFEDLNVRGYRPFTNEIWLDEEHSKFVLRELGRYHAMGVALVESKLVDTDKFQPLYILEKTTQERFFMRSFKSLRDGVSTWGPEWTESAKQLTQILDKLNHVTQRIVRFDRITSFTVVNHGDFWNGNMLFKYDVLGRVLSMKFVDFQATSYCTFAFDLMVFILSSIENELRLNKLDELLEAYRESLLANMKFYNLTTDKVPTLAEMKDTLDYLLPVTIIMISMYYPATSNESDFNVSHAYEKDESMFNAEMYKSDQCKQIIGGMLQKMRGMDVLSE